MVVWGVSVSTQIRKMEIYKFTQQKAQGFAGTLGILMTLSEKYFLDIPDDALHYSAM